MTESLRQPQAAAEAPLDRRRRSGETRARILEGARLCLLTRGFEATSVEDIVAAAGLGRATFYLHFNGKGAVLADLLSAQDEPMRKFFCRLRDLDPLDPHGIRNWLRGYVRKLRRNRDLLALFRMGASGDDSARQAVMSHRKAMIDILAERYPAFRYEHPDPAEQGYRYARCLLHLFPIEQMVNAITREGMVEEDHAIEALTDHLFRLLSPA